jgi:hypothetical protein
VLFTLRCALGVELEALLTVWLALGEEFGALLADGAGVPAVLRVLLTLGCALGTDAAHTRSGTW